MMSTKDEAKDNSDEIGTCTELKPGQKFSTPAPGSGDRVFYETLLKQKHSSEMAQDFCLAYGILENDAAAALYKKVCIRKGKNPTPTKSSSSSSSSSATAASKKTKSSTSTAANNKKAKTSRKSSGGGKILDDMLVEDDGEGGGEMEGSVGVWEGQGSMSL